MNLYPLDLVAQGDCRSHRRRRAWWRSQIRYLLVIWGAL